MGVIFWHSTPLSANFSNKNSNKLDPIVYFRVYNRSIQFIPNTIYNDEPAYKNRITRQT